MPEIYSMMQASQTLDGCFMWLSLNDAEFIVEAYVWAVYAEKERFISYMDIERMKAMVLVWLANSSPEEARQAVSEELIRIVS